MHPIHPHRLQGNALVGVLFLLLLVALALGGNYVRNYQTDQQQEKQQRPYAKYGVGDLEVLVEGYRAEIAKLERGHGAGRVATRNRHHFSDQVREFERVQRAARGSRDKAVEIAQTRRELKKLEEELARRRTGGSEMQVHLGRMFRI